MLVLDLIDDDGARAISSPQDAGAWMAAQGIRVRVSEPGLEALLTLRRAVSELVHACAGGGAPPQRALDVVNDTSAAAAVAPQLNWPAEARPRMWLATTADPEAHARAIIARAAIDLITGPDRDRLRICQAPGCQRVFVTANARRRWCSATSCGNRVRVARHAARRKQARG
jgi:predicted RNA-binding Zn ribbon-like protein